MRRVPAVARVFGCCMIVELDTCCCGGNLLLLHSAFTIFFQWMPAAVFTVGSRASEQACDKHIVMCAVLGCCVIEPGRCGGEFLLLGSGSIQRLCFQWILAAGFTVGTQDSRSGRACDKRLRMCTCWLGCCVTGQALAVVAASYCCLQLYSTISLFSDECLPAAVPQLRAESIIGTSM
jgi:hypothetical protein